MAVSMEMLKELREVTGAGVLDCKKALEASGGDFEKAVLFLRERGLAAAAKKATREANDGIVMVQVDSAASYGVVVEVNCETDFVARTENFQNLAAEIVRQVVAEPDVPDVAAMLKRPFIVDQAVTVEEKFTQVVAKIGENVVLRRFGRLQRNGPGMIEGYTHLGGRIGVIVLATTTSDDIATTAVFHELIHDVALQVAAVAPRYVSPEEIPAAEMDEKKSIFAAQLADEKKPDNIKERIITGKLEKWFGEICLMRQVFIKDTAMTIQQLVEQKSKALGAPIAIHRFVRFELGAED